MNKTIKETIILAISILNISIAVLGFSFCLENKPLQATITCFIFILIQPISYYFINKLTFTK